jgi:hypothetical protein
MTITKMAERQKKHFAIARKFKREFLLPEFRPIPGSHEALERGRH